MSNIDKKEKLFVIKTLVAMGVICIYICLFNYIIDPFYHYHKSYVDKQPYMHSAVYQTTGAAKNLSYNAAIVGTSLTENFRASWFEEYGYNGEKLSYPSATFSDYATILDAVFSSDNKVECIILDMSDFQLNSEPGSVRTHEADYLNDDSFINDYKYVLNRDVAVQSFYSLIIAAFNIDTDHDSDYTWENPEFFSKKACLKDTYYVRKQIIDAKANGTYEPFDKDTYSPYAENIGKVIPYIEANPDTTFNFFLPPFSIMYWETQDLKGRMDWIINVYRDSIILLSKYDNVKIYSFVNEEDIIANLDLYRDSGHYNPSINRYIFEHIMESDGITLDEFDVEAESLKNFIRQTDFEEIWKDWEE